MPGWGDESDDEIDVFGDAIPQEVAVVPYDLGGHSTARGGNAGMPTADMRRTRRENAFAQVEVTVEHFRLVKPPGKDKRHYVLYTVMCTGLERAWQVHKRFSEFHKLHTRLLNDLGKQKNGTLPAFPSKVGRPFEKEESKMKRRVEELSAYIRKVWQSALDGQLPRDPLEGFLTTDAHSNANHDTVNQADSPELHSAETSRAISPCLVETENGEGFVRPSARPFAPPSIVAASPTGHKIVVELPGVGEESLSITALENGVRVFGSKELDVVNGTVVHNDRQYGSFVIDFMVPEKYAPFTSFGRRLRNGCLTITFGDPGTPKAAQRMMSDSDRSTHSPKSS